MAKDLWWFKLMIYFAVEKCHA